MPALGFWPSTRRRSGLSISRRRSRPSVPGKSSSARKRWRPDMWGIVPAAGRGTRIQPLAFSKELLPVGSRMDASTERPRAVSEYLLERMVLGGASKICFVIAPGKSDILEYYGGVFGETPTAYVVQPRAEGLC